VSTSAADIRLLGGAGSSPGGGAAGLLRVAWRQHRVALLTVAAVLAGFSVFLVVQGLGMHAVYRNFGLSYAHPARTAREISLAETFQNEYLGYGLYVPRFIMFLPLFIGALIGGPLIARELETGTFRFAWTQSAGRTRWAIAKLAMLGLALTAMALAFSALFAWWYRPFVQFLGRSAEVEGVVFAARVLFGFMLGAFAGAVLRRTVPAIAVSIVAWFAVVLPTTLFLRPHFATPLTGPVDMTAKFSGSEWTLSQWWLDPHGHRLGQSAYNSLVGGLNTNDPQSWLVSHHYVLWESYQPASRFWSFQLIEASGMVVLALLLAGATVWWVRRRAT
jgi:ABC-type transport system involved in multi-copper enzyme maturation permease subunit